VSEIVTEMHEHLARMSLCGMQLVSVFYLNDRTGILHTVTISKS